MDIYGFKGEFRFLSNFYPAKVMLDGLEYSSTEHAYQAAKSDDPAYRRRIREEPKPSKVKHLGGNVKCRPNWDSLKIKVMEDLVRKKFQIPQLREKLLATGEDYLEETNFWSDHWWGVCRGNGRNELGKILMRIREEIRNVAASNSH